VEVELDVDWKLAPAYLVYLKRVLRDRDDWLREARVQFKFNLADEARDVFTVLSAHVAAPRVQLLLKHFFAAENRVRPKDDGLVDKQVSRLIGVHERAAGVCPGEHGLPNKTRLATLLNHDLINATAGCSRAIT